MAATARESSLHLFLFLMILSCFACSLVRSTVFSSTRRDILNSFHYKQVVRHDLENQPSAPLYPLTNPVTNPAAITPPLENPAPAIVTVPATNPPGAAQGDTIPTTNPTSPVTNPPGAAQGDTSPVTTPGGAQPVTNPVTTPTPSLPLTTPPTTIPIPNPTTNAPPALPGQSWCVAKSGLTQTSLQTALDYACGLGGADCSSIQQGGSCYNPNTLQNHGSFAFNSYYQKNPVQTSCDFGGSAMVTNQNPSTGSCVYPTSSASGTPSTMPTTTPSNGATIPAAGTGTPPNVLNYPPLGGGTSTGGIIGAPPNVLNYPPLGGGTSTGGIIGASPPADGSYISLSNHLQAYVGSIALMASITTTVLI